MGDTRARHPAWRSRVTRPCPAAGMTEEVSALPVGDERSTVREGGRPDWETNQRPFAWLETETATINTLLGQI
ncbi:hypothetical protein GCM10027187_71970 [Streptosporangium sandarakinum]